ncbi:MAG TPA: hypothetical protein VFB38_14010 [Chthonomonadaceae bacterium]|nr:hypothetical protein [Chthonomonadaceae bacterium]
MFIGHYGVALAGKSAAPRASLGTWVLAAQWVDLLWPIFLLLGWEHMRVIPGSTGFATLDFYDYPISHSLLADVGWAVAFGVVSFLVYRHVRMALLLGAGVLSHWILDLIVHRPDLPITPGQSERVGLGLWNSPAATMLVEIPLYALGIALYVRTTRACDGIGRYGLGAGLALLLALYLTNLGPPPPNAKVVAYMGLAGWLVVAWAYWVDRHREPVGEEKRHGAPTTQNGA